MCDSSYCGRSDHVTVLGKACTRPARSCKELHEVDSDLPSGLYMLDVQGHAFKAYCDMESRGGGWTLVMRAYDVLNEYLQYDSSFWTNNETINETNFDFTDHALTKYPAFSLVQASELRSSDAENFATDVVLPLTQQHLSIKDLFAGPGWLASDSSGGTYFTSSPYCGKYGVNLKEIFGCNYQVDCGGDHNGGARWGVRANYCRGGECDLWGFGWGPYRGGRSDRPNTQACDVDNVQDFNMQQPGRPGGGVGESTREATAIRKKVFLTLLLFVLYKFSFYKL